MDKPVLNCELLVVAPPANCAVGVQSGKGSSSRTVGAVRTTGGDVAFSVQVTVRTIDESGVRFSGPFVQEDSKGQFVYLTWGKSAGDPFSPYQRRTKIYLNVVTPDTVRQALAVGSKVRLKISGTAKDGGPACATVPVELIR